MRWANNDGQEIFLGGSWHVTDNTLQKEDIQDQLLLNHST